MPGYRHILAVGREEALVHLLAAAAIEAVGMVAQLVVWLATLALDCGPVIA